MPFGTPEADVTITYRVTGLLNQGYVGSDSQMFAFDVTRYGVSDRITKTEAETDAEILALFEFFNASGIVQALQIDRFSGTQLARAVAEEPTP